jgi:hypothetical protein
MLKCAIFIRFSHAEDTDPLVEKEYDGLIAVFQNL